MKRPLYDTSTVTLYLCDILIKVDGSMQKTSIFMQKLGQLVKKYTSAHGSFGQPILSECFVFRPDKKRRTVFPQIVIIHLSAALYYMYSMVHLVHQIFCSDFGIKQSDQSYFLTQVAQWPIPKLGKLLLKSNFHWFGPLKRSKCVLYADICPLPQSFGLSVQVVRWQQSNFKRYPLIFLTN